MTGFLCPISNTSGFSPAMFDAPVQISARHRFLDKALEGRQQFGAERAIDHAMVAGQRDGHLADEFDAAVLGLDRCAARGAHRQDGGMRRIDDGRELAHAVHAEIGDGAGAALDTRSA